MNNILDFNECSNCTACLNCCPTHAISIGSDSLFYNLHIDDNKCISCGKCKSVCPVNNKTYKQRISGAYYCQNTNHSAVMSSSSGGAFHAIASYVISLGGVVFGAVMDTDNYQVLFSNSEVYPLSSFMRSKYVESRLDTCFTEVLSFLEQGRLVLFSGSPCQVAGLIRYLGKDFKTLITCDFTCGGMPSHVLWSSYLKSIEKRYSSKAESVNFRDKSLGWGRHALSIVFQNNKKYFSQAQLDPYFSAFVNKHYSVRSSCLSCDFNNNHYSDIVMADYWRYYDIGLPYCNTGISLLLTNSLKGEELLSRINDKYIHLSRIKVSTGSYNLKTVDYSEEFLANRMKFLEECKEIGIEIASNDFIPKGRKLMSIRMKQYVNYFRNIKKRYLS